MVKKKGQQKKAQKHIKCMSLAILKYEPSLYNMFKLRLRETAS